MTNGIVNGIRFICDLSLDVYKFDPFGGFYFISSDIVHNCTNDGLLHCFHYNVHELYHFLFSVFVRDMIL